MTLSPVLTLISKWRISEALDDVARAKSMHNFKLRSFPPILSASLYVELIKFRTSWTSHTNRFFGCGKRELNIPDKEEHAKWQ